MLIEPKLDLRGTQLAGWTQKERATTLATGILFDEDIRIPMPDGVEIVADLFRPLGLGSVPVLVSWAIYIKDTERMGGGHFHR
jgi:predicted acyl esterase